MRKKLEMMMMVQICLAPTVNQTHISFSFFSLLSLSLSLFFLSLCIISHFLCSLQCLPLPIFIFHSYSEHTTIKSDDDQRERENEVAGVKKAVTDFYRNVNLFQVYNFISSSIPFFSSL